MPKLVITDDEGVREVPVHSGDTLGRVSSNPIPLKVAEASRRHCSFVLEKGSWFIEDLGSSNGTLVNGRRVTKFELQDGDVIQVGKATLRFLDVEAEAEPEVEDLGSDEISLEDEVFLVIGGARRRGEVVRVGDEVTVGRNARHHLVLKDASVSGDHATLTRDGSRFQVRDLGSSNGTYVNDRKVVEAEVQSGDVVRFGAVSCTFGIGAPSDFAPPGLAEAEASASAAPATVMMTGAQDQPPEFEIGEITDIPVREESKAWTLLALVVVLALGGGVAWLLTHPRRSGAAAEGASLARGNNLLPDWAWSFEIPDDPDAIAGTEDDEILSWDRVLQSDPNDMVEVASPVRSGDQAFLIDRVDDTGTASVAALSQLVPVTSGAVYRLVGYLRPSGATSLAFLEIAWMDIGSASTDEPILLTQDRVFAPPGDGGWIETASAVIAPDGANYARVGVGLAGSGRAVFDDISLTSAAGEAEGRVAVQVPFRAVLGPQATTRLSRYGRLLFDGLGLYRSAGTARRGQDEWLSAVRCGEEGFLGQVRGEGDDLVVTVAATDTGGLRLRYSGPGLARADGLEIPLVPGRADLAVTVLDGETGERLGQAFADRPATALIVGSGGDRAKIHLLAGDGSPLRLDASLAMEEGAPVLMVELGEVEELILDLQLSFAAELEDARGLRLEAEAAARAGKPGKAIEICRQILARFAFEEAIERETSRMLQQMEEEGRGALTTLEGRLDDAVFFRTLEREAELTRDIGAAIDRYQGCFLEEPLRKLQQRFAAELAAWRAPRNDQLAERAFKRAMDYAENDSPVLAELFVRQIIESYPDTDWADQSEALLAQILAKKAAKEGE